MGRIVELRISNFRQIKAVEIRPDGSLVVISGKNGAGKTTVLNAIWAVLKGRALAGPTPIRKDAEQCTIVCQTEEFTVTRTFKKTPDGELTTDLKLVMQDGRRITSKPQAMLDALLPDLALDPLDFMRRKPADQVDTVKALVKGFDFAANAKARQTAFDLRTDENRAATQAHSAAQAIVLPAGPEPQAVDTAGLLDRMQEAAQHNATLEQRRANREQTQRDIDTKLDEAETLRARAATLERDARALQVKLSEAVALPDPIDVESLRASLDAAERVKGIRVLFENRRTLNASGAAALARSDQLTQEIIALDATKRQAIAAAKLPVDGLSFDDEGITLNGTPFQVVSMAEKLRTSVAIGMALAPSPSDPALRIMTVDEGSELDQDSLALLHGMADAAGYQIWVARIEKGSEQGFVIVDGALSPGGGK